MICIKLKTQTEQATLKSLLKLLFTFVCDFSLSSNGVLIFDEIEDWKAGIIQYLIFRIRSRFSSII